MITPPCRRPFRGPVGALPPGRHEGEALRTYGERTFADARSRFPVGSGRVPPVQLRAIRQEGSIAAPRGGPVAVGRFCAAGSFAWVAVAGVFGTGFIIRGPFQCMSTKLSHRAEIAGPRLDLRLRDGRFDSFPRVWTLPVLLGQIARDVWLFRGARSRSIKRKRAVPRSK